jgi:hypothetical protein
MTFPRLFASKEFELINDAKKKKDTKGTYRNSGVLVVSSIEVIPAGQTSRNTVQIHPKKVPPEVAKILGKLTHKDCIK